VEWRLSPEMVRRGDQDGSEMKCRKYEDGILYNDDCLNILPTLESESIDLVLTDPPWGIGVKEYDKVNIDIKKVLEEIKRVTKPTGHICIEVGFDNHIYLDLFDELGLFYRQPIALNCINGMGRRSYVGWNHLSLVYWITKDPDVKVCKRYRDVLNWTLISTKKEDWEYPNPKNPGVYEKLILMFSVENDVVLDPFMGSGTTAIAARRSNRNFIGIEIEEKYWEVQLKRLEKIPKLVSVSDYFR